MFSALEQTWNLRWKNSFVITWSNYKIFFVEKPKKILGCISTCIRYVVHVAAIHDLSFVIVICFYGHRHWTYTLLRLNDRYTILNDFSLNHKIGMLSHSVIVTEKVAEREKAGWCIHFRTFASAETLFHCYQIHTHTHAHAPNGYVSKNQIRGKLVFVFASDCIYV